MAVVLGDAEEKPLIMHYYSQLAVEGKGNADLLAMKSVMHNDI